MAHRSSMQIKCDILQACFQPVIMSKISRAGNTVHPKSVMYVEELISTGHMIKITTSIKIKGMFRTGVSLTYLTTPKGKEFIEKFKLLEAEI